MAQPRFLPYNDHAGIRCSGTANVARPERSLPDPRYSIIVGHVLSLHGEYMLTLGRDRLV